MTARKMPFLARISKAVKRSSSGLRFGARILSPLSALLPVLILHLLFYWALTNSAQGKELISIWYENFFNLSTGIKIRVVAGLLFYLLLFYFCAYWLTFQMSKSSLPRENAPDYAPRFHSYMWIILPGSTVLFLILIMVYLFKVGFFWFGLASAMSAALCLGLHVIFWRWVIRKSKKEHDPSKAISDVAGTNDRTREDGESETNVSRASSFLKRHGIVLSVALIILLFCLLSKMIWIAFLISGFFMLYLVFNLILDTQAKIVSRFGAKNEQKPWKEMIEASPVYWTFMIPIGFAGITLVTAGFVRGVMDVISPSLTAVALGFLFCYIVVLALIQLEKENSFPLIVALIVAAVGFGFFRDGSVIQTTPPEQATLRREKIEDHFKNWLSSKRRSPVAQTEMPVYIIASEGGGIRSTYWTVGVLAKLNAAFPDLLHRTYALSGVSGGSVGHMIFLALKKDAKLLDENKGWQDIVGEDYLGESLLHLLVTTPIQKFIPGRIPELDRAIILEDDFSDSYHGIVGNRTLDEDLLGFYADTLPYALPSVFFNCTHVESGKKAIVSNLDLTSAFTSDIDILSALESSVPLKTAGLLSARFPGFSPPGMMKTQSGEIKGGVLDGGYYDNSGLITAVQALQVMTANVPDSVKIRPVVIFIRNNNSSVADDAPSPVSEYRAPISTMLNSWASKTEQTVHYMDPWFQNMGVDFIQISLDYEGAEGNEDYPLGWALSKKTQASLAGRVEDLGLETNTRVGKLNEEAFYRLNTIEKSYQSMAQ